METFILILELIGSMAFSASGAMTGIRKNMDIFGVCILGLTTAVGGGVIRDLVLGNTPPATFRSPIYATVALITAVVLFLPQLRRILLRNQLLFDRALFLMDAAGLGIFTVVGIQVAYNSDEEHNAFLLIFVGMITGVGGGVIRDLLAGNTPFILVKHFYASASLIGSVVCIVLWRYLGSFAGIAGGTFVTIVLRLLAARFHWSLPKSEMEEIIE
jgi:uncharacterized membrane protein YeiH